MPRADWNSLTNLKYKFPPIPEQIAIASILSALDDKIELNLQMNKTLEEMAMAFYKHWFVDFGHFQNGKFIDSELGMIPEGWEVKRLDKVAHKKSETFNFSNKEEVVFVNTGDVQEGRFLHSNKISKNGLPGQAKKAISQGDILYSEIRPKNKRYAYVNFDSNDYVVSTKFMIINPKSNILNKLLYRILTMQSTVDNFNSIADGRSGTFPQITFDAISEMQIILPPLNIQNEFQNIVSPMELQQDELYSENQTLTTLRDTLLPKLISGEVRVKDIEQLIAEIL
jgi:type I restriction enzyme S subunit